FEGVLSLVGCRGLGANAKLAIRATRSERRQ
ncbi:MAG: hypothetical protein ACI84R_003461, partial [Candidatus Azotimanducaceae bacterium]